MKLKIAANQVLKRFSRKIAKEDAFKALRRARAKKFPYALFFLIEPDALLVVACFHASRDPRQWQNRV
jgi:hypothetical protein